MGGAGDPGVHEFSGAVSIYATGMAWMGAAAVAELVGGVLVLLGLFTRVGAFLIFCVMLTAMLGVHWSKGFFMSNMGIEYSVALLGMALALLMAGGGQASADRRITGRR